MAALVERLATLGPGPAPDPRPTAFRQRALGIIAGYEPLLLLALAPLLLFPRSWSPWLLLAFPLLWLARRQARGRLSVRTPYDLPLAFLVLCLPVTLLPLAEWGPAAPRYYTLLLGLALVYALANALTTPERVLRGAVATVLLLGGGLALVGLVGTDWTANKLLPLDAIYGRLPRLVSGLVHATPRGAIHPNEIGGALALLLPLGLALTLAWRPVVGRLTPIPRLLIPAVTAVMALVLLLSQSRSAYIGTAVGVLLVHAWWIWRLPRPVAVRAALSGLLLLTLATAAWLAWHLVASWITSAEGGLNTLPTRLELWDRGLYMLQDFPFTGIGMGQFSLVLHSLYTPFLTGSDTHVPHVHNYYLQLALDLGLPAALAFLLVLGAFLRGMWRVATRPGDGALQMLAVGLGAGLLSFLIYGLTDAIAIGARGGIGLWIVLGLGAGLMNVSPEQRQ